MRTVEVKVPDLGDYRDVPIIEILVKPGDAVRAEEALLTLESDKATLDIPSPAPGTVRELKVKVGDRVSEGTLVLVLDAEEAPAKAPAPRTRDVAPPAAAAPAPIAAPTPAPPPTLTAAPTPTVAGTLPAAAAPEEERRDGVPHASPSVRKFARELGVDLGQLAGSGPRGRIVREDVQRAVKDAMTGASGARVPGAALDLPPWPRVDFARFGPVEARPLARIRRISAANLARNWVMIPHVTHHDEADVTDLERFREDLNRESAAAGVKVTVLAFAVKASVAALKRFPELNASLDGDRLILKRYYHVGFAADTPEGLVVPVLRDADRKGLLEIARELAELATKARAGKLSPAEMQGASFSISSLGGIGGTAFTPIIQAPEVAILGVSRIQRKPVWDGERFVPRLVLPLSLSYDHRVVDGALGARFLAHLGGVLSDFRRAML